MSRLLAGLEQAAAGRGGVVLLAGEPGIGKSHALRQLIERARGGCAIVLAGRCVEGAWVPPFRPFAEAIAGYGESAGPQRLRADLAPALVRIAPRLSELLPELEPPRPCSRMRNGSGCWTRPRFFAALSARATVLLVLDDLHWADAGTAMMMRHVARSCGQRRLLIAGAYRTTEAHTTEAGRDPLGDALGAMQAESECATIRLRPLSAGAIGQLLAAEAGTARTAARLGRAERAMAMLASAVRALTRAPAWTLNYTRTASDGRDAVGARPS